MTEWKEQANEWMRIAYSAKTSQLLPKYQYHILDRCLRGSSDIISCESTVLLLKPTVQKQLFLFFENLI